MLDMISPPFLFSFGITFVYSALLLAYTIKSKGVQMQLAQNKSLKEAGKQEIFGEGEIKRKGKQTNKQTKKPGQFPVAFVSLHLLLPPGCCGDHMFHI